MSNDDLKEIVKDVKDNSEFYLRPAFRFKDIIERIKTACGDDIKYTQESNMSEEDTYFEPPETEEDIEARIQHDEALSEHLADMKE